MASRFPWTRAVVISATLVCLAYFPSCASARAALSEQIALIAKDAGGRVGVACSLPGVVLDCSSNANAKLPMQSVFKLPLAMAVLDAVEHGKFALASTIKFLPSDLISPGQHSPLRNENPKANVDVQVNELLRLAVAESDGVAADILIRVLGGPAVVDGYVRHLGITGIRIRDNEKTLGEDVRAQYRNYSQPDSMVALLRKLADQSPLTPEHTRLLLGWMTETDTGEHRIKGLLPVGTIVAHKTGTSGQDDGVTHATNDVGLVTLPDGRILAVAVFVADSPASESVRENVIARIARAIWDNALRASRSL